ncbi:MAG: ATP-binding cassette domain-containing protein [Flavobacterium sp.]|nr:ATP-binding cassette domain-containing protein [Flavobacterium sp.]
MISTKNLHFTYNSSTSFHFPDLSCEKSDSLLITGGSGKGKTTLLHLLGGLQRAESGSIIIDDCDITSLSNRELDRFRGQNIGIVLQQSHFVASLNVLENLTLSSWLASGKQSDVRALELLDHLGLADQKHKAPAQLSIGQQQRASIARALINQPKLLLADEPTSSLDDMNAEVVASLLSDLSKEYNAALIIVTHDQRLKQRFEKSVEL